MSIFAVPKKTTVKTLKKNHYDKGRNSQLYCPANRRRKA